MLSTTLPDDAARLREPLPGAGFWRGYWVTLRPYLFFVSGSSGLVGLALAGEMPGLRLAAASAVFSLSYGLGQALTDVFQVDTDSLSSPYRPLVRGEISRRAVLLTSLGGLGLCAAVLLALNPWTLLFSAAAVAGLLAYTPLKRSFWGGPPCNAAIVASLPVIGLLCGIPSPARAITHPGLVPAAASVFFSYAVFVILGYFKDVEADRRTGYQTLPVRFGRRVSVGVSALFAGGAALSSTILVRGRGFLASLETPERLLAIAFWGGGLLLLALAHARILRTNRDDEAYPAIALAVRGFVALHLGEAALLHADLSWFAPPAYALFEVALAGRPCRTQI